MTVFSPLSIPPRQRASKHWLRLLLVSLWLIVGISASINLPAFSTSAAAQSSIIRINAGGGGYTAPDGRVWSADTGFSGGGTYAVGATIAGTSDATLYQSERFGNFSYNLSVPNGTYQVTLKFAEIWFTTAGQRVFNVTMEGQTVLSNFDILKQVTFNTALDKSFTVNVTDGQLNVAFASVISNPKVSAIEVVPSGGAAPAPTPAPATTAAYWGAFSKNPITGGAPPWDMGEQDRLETMVGKKASLIPLTVYWQQSGQYYYFMGNSKQYFPTTTMEAIRQRGSIPMLVWAAADNTLGVNQPNFRSSVVAGGAHDAYIRAFAQQARAWGKPFFVKLNWEMNGYWNWPWMEGKDNGTTIPNGNQPGDFVRSWRHIHDIFVQEGATNATWVWCPNVADGWSAPFSQVYPGDTYVDWTCLHGYNWGNLYNPPGWQSFAQVFNSSFNANSYQQVVGLAPAKPMMLGEWASTELGDGGTAKANWITDALNTQIPNNFPQVRAIVWYSVNDGQPWPVDSTTPSLTAIRNSLASNFYKANTFGALPGTVIPPPAR